MMLFRVTYNDGQTNFFRAWSWEEAMNSITQHGRDRLVEIRLMAEGVG